jgi:hypothetical protein
VVQAKLKYPVRVPYYLEGIRRLRHCRPKDIAQEAYEDAKKFVETELRHNGKAKDILQGNTSMKDVVDVVEEAKERYEKDTAENTVVLGWLDKFSGTILYYSNILDVLAQHHPEYLCLAWGSVKFVLQVSLLG